MYKIKPGMNSTRDSIVDMVYWRVSAYIRNTPAMTPIETSRFRSALESHFDIECDLRVSKNDFRKECIIYFGVPNNIVGVAVRNEKSGEWVAHASPEVLETYDFVEDNELIDVYGQ